MSPKIAVLTPVLYEEEYIREFIRTALELGHIPSFEEFKYSEPDNSEAAAQENTSLMALSFTAAINTEQHKKLMAIMSPRIRDTFQLFKSHGVVLSIFENNYNNSAE